MLVSLLQFQTDTDMVLLYTVDLVVLFPVVVVVLIQDVDILLDTTQQILQNVVLLQDLLGKELFVLYHCEQKFDEGLARLRLRWWLLSL